MYFSYSIIEKDIDKTYILFINERLLIKHVENEKDEEYYSIDSIRIYKENSDRWISHLDALYKMYNMRNIELEKLVLKTFPNSGYVDKITKIEVAEIKIKEKFLWKPHTYKH